MDIAGVVAAQVEKSQRRIAAASKKAKVKSRKGRLKATKVVLIGKKVKKIVQKDPNRQGPLTKLKKQLLKERCRRAAANAAVTGTEPLVPLEKVPPDRKKLTAAERKAIEASLPRLQCKWEGCDKSFPGGKDGIVAFREHLVIHAKKQPKDELECRWEGCAHEPFLKLRSLRFHTQRHVKSNRPFVLSRTPFFRRRKTKN